MGESIFPCGKSSGGVTISNVKYSGIIQSTSPMSGGAGSDNTYKTIGSQKFTVNAGYGLMCVLLTDLTAILQGGSVSGNKIVNLYMGIFLNSSSPSYEYFGQQVTAFTSTNKQYSKDLVTYSGFNSDYSNGSGFLSFCTTDVTTITVYAQLHTPDNCYYSSVIPKIEFNLNAYIMDFM